MSKDSKTVTKRSGKGYRGARPVFVVFDEIDNFVESHPNMRFSGWDVEVLRFDPMGWSKPNGIQVNGIWHTREIVSPDPCTGFWAFDGRDTHVAAR